MTDLPTLRLTQTRSQDNSYTIELEWLGAGSRQTATALVSVALTDQDQQDIRWYLEEYPEYPFSPHPERAARVESRMRELGLEFFNKLFTDRTLRLWSRIADQLDNIRIEIVTDVEEASSLPWELLRDPATDTVLALHAKAFVRAAPEAPRQALAVEQQHVIRILLVICRPAGGADVPFRSVATRLLKGLSTAAREVFQLDVLRPPTYDRLAQVLHDAKSRGEPYHVVHFDGHGVYGQPNVLPVDASPIKFHGAGPQGFLVFESRVPGERRELVHGSRLGDLLVQCDVPLLILNACRSAHADQPRTEDDGDVSPAPPLVDDDNPYEKVRALGSLAQQVMLSGVGGVVAMRYNVFVVTAAQFIAELYRALVQGGTLGEAVTRGRKHLYEQPLRKIVEQLALQDWMVPIVYEAQPMQVFTPLPADRGPEIRVTAAGVTPERGDLDVKLPKEPDVGFFGRDETLLALDRAFDNHHVVLLHAYAGSGKTTAAAEFARWYALTGGVDGPVLFTSFEHYNPLLQILDLIGEVFDALLRRNSIQWDAMTDLAQKRELALQILRQRPVLFVWDNVEPVVGFPTGTPSTWTATEQVALADFLRAAHSTQAKFLLTSRRDEHGWLGDLPARVTLPPMPMHERWQLAEALATKYGIAFDQAAWRPLLIYSEGNPMTLTVVVSQALRDRLLSAAQIAAFVQQLRAGEAILDNQSEERSTSLGAALSYGFAAAFAPDEQAILALLHLFQAFVDVRVLILMGTQNADWHIPAVAGMTWEGGIALLDRMSEIGLLTALGNGHYRIHPALPWFFRRLYDEDYAAPQVPEPRSSISGPTRAYVGAYSVLAKDFSALYEQHAGSNHDMIASLKAEEANLLNAWRLARQHDWYDDIICTMQGLHVLYVHTGRRAEWRQLVVKAVPIFVDSETNVLLSGREFAGTVITMYLVQLLREDRQWTEATRLQNIVVDYHRQEAAPLLTLSPEQLTDLQRNTLRTLGLSLLERSEIQREEGTAACVDGFMESYDLLMRIEDLSAAAGCAFCLGRAYEAIAALRDLGVAEQWYRRSLELGPANNVIKRWQILGQLASVARERLLDAIESRQPREVLEHLWTTTVEALNEALQMFPPDALDALATTHQLLGQTYGIRADLPACMEQGIAHFREAIKYRELEGNLYEAANARHNAALVYAQAGRFEDALRFMRAALRNYEQLATTTEVTRSQQLITRLEQEMRGRNGDAS